jgi:hypothetical protein
LKGAKNILKCFYYRNIFKLSFKVYFMFNEKDELEDLAGKFSYRSAQEFIESMPYDYETADERGKYRVSSPKKSLERGCVMCIDGALLLAALTGLRPEILRMHFEKTSHAVLLTQDKNTGMYGALGKSRHSSLQFREQIYTRRKDLVRSYDNPFIGDALAYSVVCVDSQLSDWMTTEKNIDKLIRWDKVKKTKRFSILLPFGYVFSF